MSNCNNLGFVLSAGELILRACHHSHRHFPVSSIAEPLCRDSSILSPVTQVAMSPYPGSLVRHTHTHTHTHTHPRVFAEYRATYVAKRFQRVNNEAEIPFFRRHRSAIVSGF